MVHAARVKEENARSTLDKPSAVEKLDAGCLHAVQGLLERWLFGLESLNLHGRCLVRKRANEAVAVAILLVGDGSLGLDDRVDTTDCDRLMGGSKAGRVDVSVMMHERVNARTSRALTLVGNLPSALEE